MEVFVSEHFQSQFNHVLKPNNWPVYTTASGDSRFTSDLCLTRQSYFQLCLPKVTCCDFFIYKSYCVFETRPPNSSFQSFIQNDRCAYENKQWEHRRLQREDYPRIQLGCVHPTSPKERPRRHQSPWPETPCLQIHDTLHFCYLVLQPVPLSGEALGHQCMNAGFCITFQNLHKVFWELPKFNGKWH